jgi:hypothetical protein
LGAMVNRLERLLAATGETEDKGVLRKAGGLEAWPGRR